MRYEEERLKRIIRLMDEFHSETNSLYENLVDEDFDQVKLNLRNFSELIDYVRKSISNEI